MDMPVHKYLAKDLSFRASLVDATEAVRSMQGIQNTYPLATMASGRSMVAALLMASQLKQDHLLSVYFRGDGPLEMVFAEATFEGEVRAFTPQPQVELPLREGRVDVGAGVGRGFLTVVRTTPNQKAPHRGTVEIQTGEIGDDIAYYLQQSHQIPSVVVVGVKVNNYGLVLSAGGILIELMPGASEQVITRLEQKVAKAPSFSESLAAGAKAQDLLKVYLGGLEVEELPHPYPVQYKCRCSKDRLLRSLSLFGANEIEEMLAGGETPDARCEFCGRTYQVEPQDLQNLIAELRRSNYH